MGITGEIAEWVSKTVHAHGLPSSAETRQLNPGCQPSGHLSSLPQDKVTEMSLNSSKSCKVLKLLKSARSKKFLKI